MNRVCDNRIGPNFGRPLFMRGVPKDWVLNPDKGVVDRVLAALERTGGDCPCVPHIEWNEATRCPCLKCRSGEGCHCGLYVKEE